MGGQTVKKLDQKKRLLLSTNKIYNMSYFPIPQLNKIFGVLPGYSSINLKDHLTQSFRIVLSSCGFDYNDVDSSRFEDVYYNKEIDIKAIISSYDGPDIVSLYKSSLYPPLIGTFKSLESLKSRILSEKREITINKILKDE